MSLYNKYKVSAATTSNPIDQFILIFDEIIKLLHQSIKCMEIGDIEGKYKHLDKVTDVLHVLRSGIDVENNEEVKYLAQFYEVAIRKIDKINFKTEDIAGITEVIKAVASVRDTIAALAKEESKEEVIR